MTANIQVQLNRDVPELLPTVNILSISLIP